MVFKVDWSGRSTNYTDEEINTVISVMKHADPQTQGNYLKQFEKDFSDFVGSPYCFGVTNCTHALELIADLTYLKKGDEVIIPAHTYCASAIPFARTGATIRWTDIDSETFNISLESIKKSTNEHTKVIVLVHLYGLMCDVEPIAKFAKEKGIALVEDCAQSLGAFKNNKCSGSFGDFSAFSFHCQKNMSTLGEGGMLVVRDKKLADIVPGIRHNGHTPYSNQIDYWKPAVINVDLDIENVWPHNFSLTETQAALGSLLLKRLPQLTENRRKRFYYFKERLSKFNELVLQKIEDPSTHAHHLLACRYDGEQYGKTHDDLIRMLSAQYGVKTVVQYHPLYRYDLFKKMGMSDADCPNTDYFFDRMISFPFHVWLSDEDFEYTIESTISALTALREESSIVSVK